MTRTLCLLAGLTLTSLPLVSQAQKVTALGQSSFGRKIMIGPGSSQSATRVSDLDLSTGEHTNVQYYTTEAPGTFTAMARNAAGALYAVQSPNRLVTIDESTGVATDVVEIKDSALMGAAVRCPAIAFVPGDPETLYAIIKRSDIRVMKGGDIDVLASIETGFILVTVNLETGFTVETGIYLGGQQFGQAHGLVYDADLGRLIHGYTEESENDSPSPGAVIELINLTTQMVETAEYFENFNTPDPSDPRPINSSQRPSGFQGMAGLGNGELIVYSNTSGQFFYVDIDELGPIGGGGFYEYTSYSATIPLSLSNDLNYSGLRALALSTDQQNLLIDIRGEIQFHTTNFVPVDTAPLLTSVGGFPLSGGSIATQPGSGRIYALARRGNGKGGPGLSSGESSGKIGLHILDREGPEEILLGDLDLEFSSAIDDERLARNGDSDYVNHYAIQSITFDDLGNLYGYDADSGRIVRINQRTGEVTAYSEYLAIPGGNVQLEFNPEDGKFYVLAYNGNLIMGCVSRSGDINEIEVVGDIPNMPPNSFVFVGNGKFFFTSDFVYGPGEDFILCVDTLGNVDVVFPDEILATLEDEPLGFYVTYGLSRIGNLATADVSVGTRKSRLRGNNIYNRSGRGQTIVDRKRVKRLSTSFFSRVENDGNYAGSIELRGSRVGRRDRISYIAGGRNVTAAMIRGFEVEFDARSSTDIKVSLSRRGTGRWTTNTRISANYGSRTDLGAVKSILLGQQRKKRPRKPSSLF